MIEKIKRLEQISRRLQPDENTRQHWFQLAGNYANDFLNQLPDRPTYMVTEEKGQGILDLKLSEEGRSMETLLYPQLFNSM